MRAEKVGSETMLAQIVQMVAAAQRSRAPMQRLADVVAGWFVLAVIGVAALTFFVWGMLRARAALGLRTDQRGGGADHRLPVCAGAGHADVDHGRHRHGPPRAACCSATPRRSRTCARIDTLIVDKTGTLTEGKPAFDRVVAANGWNDEDVLRIAASLDQGSEHPLAAGDRREARKRELKLVEPESFESDGRHRRARQGRRPVDCTRQHRADGRS